MTTKRKTPLSTERLARNAKAGREARGWGLHELARRSELAQKTVYDFECMRVTPLIRTVAKLAEALGIDLETIMMGTEEDVRAATWRAEIAATLPALSTDTFAAIAAELRPGGLATNDPSALLQAFDAGSTGERVRAIATLRRAVVATKDPT
ncbi:MAG: helix-turn-helix transcriptional regulator [Coriobacteriia bacterium]|nr:helix-turn-helix transcriptional regulator [Coriobacteriia bacterium]